MLTYQELPDRELDMATRRLDEYEPLERSLLYLLRATVHLQETTARLRAIIADRVEPKELQQIDDRMEQVSESIDAALKALEASAQARELNVD